MKKSILIINAIAGIALLTTVACSTADVSTILNDIDNGVNLAITVYGLLGSPELGSSVSPSEVTAIETYISQANTLFGDVATDLASSASDTTKTQEIYNEAIKVVEPDLSNSGVSPTVITEINRIQTVVTLLLNTYASGKGATTPSFYVGIPTKYHISSANRAKALLVKNKSEQADALFKSHKLHATMWPWPNPNSPEPPKKNS